MGLSVFGLGLSLFDDTYVTSGSITLKPSGDLDDYFTFATASNVPTIYGTGAYLRIGDAATTAHSLASEDDLMVTGKLEVKGAVWIDNGLSTGLLIADDGGIAWGASNDARFMYETADADAKCMVFVQDESTDSGNNVPAWVFGELTNVFRADLNLLDEVAQPHIVAIDNAGKYFSAATATSDDGGATVELLMAGVGTNAVIGDRVRVTAGTNATPGWYFIDTVVGANEVDLDRNWCTGDVSGGTISSFHQMCIVSAHALYLPIYDAAPDDDDLDMDMDGAMALEVTQANGRLYWRANNGWHYVDATGGMSLPADERIDASGHEFEIGDTVKLVVDKINDDGSFHAMPIYGG